MSDKQGFDISVWRRTERGVKLVHEARVVARDGFEAARIVARRMNLRESDWQSTPSNKGHTPWVIRNDSRQ